MGRITLIATLQSNIQSGLKAIGSAATSVGNAMNGMGARANAASGMIGKLGNVLQTATTNATAAAQAMQKATAAQHQHGITTMRLITMMVKFGIILNALRIVSAPLGWMAEGVQSAIALDKGLRNIVGMLANVGDSSSTLDDKYKRLTIDATNLQMKYGQTTDAVVEGMYKIASVVDTLNFEGVRSVVDKTSFAIESLGNIAAQAAVAGMTDFATTADSMTAVLNGLNIPVLQSKEVMDILFQTVRLGKAEFKAVASDLGILSGAFSAFTKPGEEMKMLSEAGGLYGFFTTFLPTDRARTALQRMGTFLTGESAQTKAMVEQIRTMSGGTVKLRAGDVKEQGLMTTFKQIAGFMDPKNPMLQNYIEQQAGHAVSGTEMEGVRIRMLTAIFKDARAATAALRVLGTDGTASLDKITAAMAGSGGAMDRALGEGEKSISFRINQLHESIIATARGFSEGGMGNLGGVFGGIADRLSLLNQRPAYKDSDMGAKIGFIFGDLYQAFSQWYNSGGKTQMISTATQLGTDMGHFIMGVLGLNIKGAAETGQFKDAWYDAGKSAGGAFLGGLLSAINPTAGPAPATQVVGQSIPVIQGIQNMISRGSGGPVVGALAGWQIAKQAHASAWLQLASAVVGGASADSPLGVGIEALAAGLLLKKGIGGFSNWKAGLQNTPTGAFLNPLAKGAGAGLKGAAAGGLSTLFGKFGGVGSLKFLSGATKMLKGTAIASGIGAGIDILTGQDPMYAVGDAVASILGSVIGGGIGGLVSLPLLGTGAIPGAIAGGFGGHALYEKIFGGGNTNKALGADLPTTATTGSSVIDDYFAAKNGGSTVTNGNVVIIQVDKLADTITAGTPEEAAKMADDFFARFVAKLEGTAANMGKSVGKTGGGGGSAILQP